MIFANKLRFFRMLSFIFRRLGESILVMLGVLLLTFLMFQMAAGDPAAAVLGKNPKPQEIENLRRELKSDLPMFYGHWRTSEVYTACDYQDKFVELPGITAMGTPDKTDRGVNGTLVWKRRFDVPEKVLVKAAVRGVIKADGKEYYISGFDFLEFDRAPEELLISGRIQKVDFFRYQDNPLNSQFINSLRELVDFKKDFPCISILNFGKTITTREPINDILARGIWPSLSVMLPVFLLELLLGIVLALIAAACKDSWVDRILLVLSVAGMSISYLVLILAGQWYLGYYLNIFPVWGWNGVRYLALPILLGVISGLGGGVRFYRTVFVNELKSEYLRTALAKGCSPAVVYSKHLLRCAMIPIIARASAQLPFIFTGSLLLESFFGIPGLGYVAIDALNNSDLALLKALTIVNALLFVVINLLADLLCAWADPRIRLK